MKLSIVIPAYNEEDRIALTLEKYYNFFSKKLNKDFEILVVLNNCSDKTNKVVHNFWKAKNKPRNFCSYIIHGYCGKGAAVMKGFEIVNGDLIGFVDADNSVRPEEFWKLVKNIEDADGIISSRKVKGAKIIPPRGWKENLSSNLFTGFTRKLFRMQYADTQCGGKLFINIAAKHLLKNYTENGWIFDVDLLWLCKQANMKIKEQPIMWTDCAGGSVTVWSGIKSVFQLINYRIKKIPDVFRFLFVGGMATLIDILMFNVYFLTSGIFILSRFGGIVTSMIWNFIMNKKFTFASDGEITWELPRWLIVYAAAMGSNAILSTLTYNTIGPGGIEANIAAVLGLVISLPIAYLGSKYWIFKT